MQLCIILIENFQSVNKTYLTFSSVEEALQALSGIILNNDDIKLNSNIDENNNKVNLILEYIKGLKDFKFFIEHKSDKVALQLKPLSWIKEELNNFFNLNA